MKTKSKPQHPDPEANPSTDPDDISNPSPDQRIEGDLPKDLLRGEAIGAPSRGLADLVQLELEGGEAAQKPKMDLGSPPTMGDQVSGNDSRGLSGLPNRESGTRGSKRLPRWSALSAAEIQSSGLGDSQAMLPKSPASGVSFSKITGPFLTSAPSYKVKALPKGPVQSAPKSGAFGAAKSKAKAFHSPIRSGKSGLDTFIARMGRASITMMDALAGRHGVPYELSLPCLLHVLSLSLSPRLQIREDDFSSAPVLQIQVGAFPKVGKSLAYKAIVGVLHKLIDAGVFPDTLQNAFTEIGLLQAANADSWNSVGLSDPDGSQIIRIMTVESGKAAFALDFHAKGFCGERYERVTAEGKDTISHLHMGSLVMAQPERITEFFGSVRVREKGLLNRTLQFQALEALPRKQTALSVDQAKELLEPHIRRFAAIRSAEKAAGVIPVTFSSEAHEWLEGERGKPDQSILRRDELGARLAVILHAERIADQNPEGDLEALLKDTEIGLEDLEAAFALCDVCESYTRNAEICSEEAHEKVTHAKADQLESVLLAHGGSARIVTLVDELRMARKTINTLVMANPDRFEKGEPDYSGKKGQPALVIRLIERDANRHDEAIQKGK